MSFLKSLFGAPNTKPDFTGLQIQTSTSTLPIPIVWGMTKLAVNVVWYNNFKTSGGEGGKGGLFSTPSNSYSYTADLILALCEGPISAINQIWKDQDIYSLSSLSLTLFEGTTPQSTWGYLASAYPGEALAYQGTAYVCAASYQLGDSASIGNHNFEVINAFSGGAPNGVDADPAAVIYDFLTNSQYGAGFAASSINTSTLYGGGAGSTDGSLQAYCAALGIGISPALTSQEQASSVLARWLQICNCGAVWSGTQLKFIPYGDAAISTAAVTFSISLAIPQSSTDPNDVINPQINVSSPSLWVSDGGVKYTNSGAPLTFSGYYVPGSSVVVGQGQYFILNNGGGVYIFSPSDMGAGVTVTFTRGVSRGYTPNLTAEYSLTDSDFIATKPGEEPIKVSRLDPFTLPNIQRVECCSRPNQYGSTPVEARDQSQIELFGPRVGSTVTAHEICDDILVGPIVAQTILQRGLYVRAHFKFGLGWEFGLLEPMDIVEITDANLGLVNYPVRITEIDEDENGMLSVTAEELTVGISTPVLYPTSSPTGFQSNHGVTAAAVNAPLIYEPPPALTGNVAEIWLGASGGVSGSADPYWGGAYIYVSLDDTSYGPPIGQVTQPLRQGVLTANLAAASGWDTTDTLSVSLSESGGVLDSGSMASAQSGAPLALVDQELLAYETATLSGTSAYNLTGLQRGLYSSSAAAHSTGGAFSRLDGAVFKYTVPANLIGQTLYFKFQSYNVFGSGLQQLSTCVAYSHALAGTGIAQPVDITGFGAALTQGAPGSGNTYTLAGQWTADPNSASYEVDISVNSGATWTTIYAGSAPQFSVNGFAYIASLFLRVKGISGPYSSPSYTEITVAAPAQTSVAATNVGLMIEYDDISVPLIEALGLEQIAANSGANIAMLANALAAQTATNTVSAQMGQLAANITSTVEAQVSSSSALAQSVTTLTATVAATSATVTTNYAAQASENASLAASISSVAAMSSAGLANGSIQFVAASSLDTGVSAAFELEVSATGAGGTFAYCGIRAEALSAGGSQIVIDALQVIIETPYAKIAPFVANSDGTLTLQGVTKIASTLVSLGNGTDGSPYMTQNFGSAPSLVIDDGT